MEQVFAYIEKHRLVLPGQKIIAGVSGGADSTFLLWVLKEYSKRVSFDLAAVHVHHQIRGEEADRDRDFVKAFCEQLAVPFYEVNEDVPARAREKKISLEAAGREARYEAFEKIRIMLGGDRIAVAHHREDNAETVLMHMLRGSGLTGLSGMQPQNGCIIRPLLSTSRRDIERILTKEGLGWCEDSTNAQDDYSRNKIRHHLIPYMEEVNCEACEHILKLAERATQADACLMRLAEEMVVHHAVIGKQEIFLSEKACEEADPAVLPYILRCLLETLTGERSDWEEVHIRQMEGLFEKQVGRRIDLPKKVKAERVYSGVRVFIPEQEEDKSAKEILPELCFEKKPRDSLKKIPENPYTKWFDYDKIENCLSIRHRQAGDYISIAPAGKKTIRQFMVDQKIPREQRDAIWLLADGCHIVWVLGYRISEYYKVTEETGTILEVNWLKEQE